jgi:uncharacterized damage-inducible protein DinB
VDIVSIVQYSTSAQQRLYDFLSDKPGAVSYKVDTLAEFKSIRDILVHLNGAEERWTKRIVGYELPQRYEASAPDSMHELYADWRRLRSATEAAARAADADELKRAIPVKLQTSRITLTLTIEQILFHILNHENFHRGQCSMLLQQQKIDPPYFDFIYDFMPK